MNTHIVKMTLDLPEWTSQLIIDIHLLRQQRDFLLQQLDKDNLTLPCGKPCDEVEGLLNFLDAVLDASTWDTTNIIHKVPAIGR